jgi:hypothetical protein
LVITTTLGRTGIRSSKSGQRVAASSKGESPVDDVAQRQRLRRIDRIVHGQLACFTFVARMVGSPLFVLVHNIALLVGETGGRDVWSSAIWRVGDLFADSSASGQEELPGEAVELPG